MSREIDCPVRNMKLDDKECILVQFKNERKKPVQVAFQAWLKNKDNVQINNEVIIKWPIDVDVLCAKAMEKKQKTMKADQWQDLVVKILAIGKWTDMAQQAKNIEKFGIANPTREQRRSLCKRDGDALQSCGSDSEQESEQGNSNRFEQLKKNASKIKKKRKTSMNTNANVLSQIDNLNKEAVFQFSEEDTADEYDYEKLDKLSKGDLIDKIKILEEEISRLKKDNARLRTLRCVNEDLEKLKVLSNCILNDFKNLQKDISSSSSRHRAYNDKSFSNIQKHSLMIYSGSNESDKASDRDKDKIPSDVQQEDNSAESRTDTVITTPVKPAFETEKQIDKGKKTEAVKRSLQEENMIDFGGRLIEKEKINRIDKNKGLTSYTSSLMGIVFSSEEMATSTMTGTVSNFHKGVGSNKKELKSSVRDAVIDFVMKTFAVTNDVGGVFTKSIKTAMKVKLNNEASNLKKKKLLQSAMTNQLTTSSVLSTAQEEP